MQYGKIENYKIIGTCQMQTADFPDEIPNEAVLSDYLIDGVLYPATEYAGKIPTVTKKGVTWSDNQEVIWQNTLTAIREIDNSIAEIELKTYRPLREIAIGIDTDGTALAKLTGYQEQIETLRAQRAEYEAQISA